MEPLLPQTSRRGFSLVELLIAVAIISTLAAVAIVNFTNVSESGKEAANRSNARQFCSLYHSARAAGAQFKATEKEGIFDELQRGKTGAGNLVSTRFVLNLADSDKGAVLNLCEYDPVHDFMSLRSRSGE